MSEWHTSEPKEERKRVRKEEADEKKRKEEAKKRKEEEEAEKKKKEEEGKKKRKEVEEVEKKKSRGGRAEEEGGREAEEGGRGRRERRKSKRGRRRRKGGRRRRSTRGRDVIFPHPHCPDEFQLGREKGDNWRYIRDLMFGGTLEGYDNFLTFKDIRKLLFGGQSESVIIDCYVNTYLLLPRQENPNIFKTFGYLGATLKGYVQSYKDDKSKQQHLDYAFQRLDRAPTELDLLFTPMHVGTNHWALLVINIKEKEFYVYNLLRNKDRPDIPQYVNILRRYMKGRDIDSANWSPRNPDPCPQQGSGDDCAIFTCKYMECLACRDTQGFPFAQDDMPSVRARFSVHFIKVYFNAQERSQHI
ncbi:hypothetical protein Taro_028506 [Colocasia esculenta]|uniref:Ubiquitin-like protease family profile domain-containing protein n=1 Tax=Colocasia esculenta TaxID=4460 RepID=A0A843VNC3_COLES|nr:hypothetical protein [Colocasia esculenta]